MKGLFIVILCALFIYLALHFFGSKDDKSYVERTIDGLQKAKTTMNTANARPIKIALLAFRGHHGSYPDDLEELVPEYLTSKRQILDSWGNPFRLERKGSEILAIISVGLDGVLGTDDDMRFQL